MFRLGLRAPTQSWTGTLEYYESVTPPRSPSPPAIAASSAPATGLALAASAVTTQVTTEAIQVGSQVVLKTPKQGTAESTTTNGGVVEKIEGTNCWIRWTGSEEAEQRSLEEVSLKTPTATEQQQSAPTSRLLTPQASAVEAPAATVQAPVPPPTNSTPPPNPPASLKLSDKRKLVLEPAKFGQKVVLGVVLWLDFAEGGAVTGSIEISEFRARIRVEGHYEKSQQVLTIEEKELLAGRNTEWNCRFGQDSFVSGTRYRFTINDENTSEDMSCEFTLPGGAIESNSGNKEDISNPMVIGQLKVQRKRLFYLSQDAHGSSMVVPKEKMSVRLSPLGGESSLAGLALSEVGFSRGVHYWEIKVESADEHGTVFCGVVERQPSPVYPAGVPVPNLNKWEKVPVSWGFINFRATLWMTASSSTGGTEQIYGEFFDTGDVVGILLDLDMGEISFFIDALKFGEHIMRDLGAAFVAHQLGSRIPFKWNPTAETHVIYPAIGLKRCAGDAVSVSSKYISFASTDPEDELANMSKLSSLLRGYFKSNLSEEGHHQRQQEQDVNATTNVSKQRSACPDWFAKLAYSHYTRWSENKYRLVQSRAGGRLVELDISEEAMMAASILGDVTRPFFVGEKVKTIQSQNRELSSPETAAILGARLNRIWYTIATVSMHEGFGDGATWAFYWEPDELALLMRDEPEEGLKTQTKQNGPILTWTEFQDQVCGQDWTNEMDYELVRLMNFILQREGEHDPMNLDFNHDYSGAASLLRKSTQVCKGRIALLRLFNCMVKRALPFFQPPTPSVTAQATTPGSTASDPADTAVTQSSSPSFTATNGFANWCYRSRKFILTIVKRTYWEAVLKATTTGTTLSSEEYVDPPQIRTVVINRIKATPAKLASIMSDSKRLKRSVFGQLYAEMLKWPDHAFRRAYCGKGHGGQKRAFKLKLVGEGVDDYGGPYRQAFEVVCDELQNDTEWPDSRRACLLPLLIPCSNRYSGVGDVGRDKFVLNPSARSPSLLRRFEFLGKLMGTAVRHGLQLGLDFPTMFWRKLVALPVTRKHLEEIDISFVRDLKSLEACTAETFVDLVGSDRKFQVVLSDGTIAGGDDAPPVTFENVQEYVKFALNVRLKESDAQLQALKKGLNAVLPLEHFSLYTAEELETLICGRRELDVELLKSVTEYEGVQASDAHVKWFWEVLEEMNAEDRTAFLKFVWARSRMPSKAEMSTAFHLLQPSGGASENPDKYLPSAQTCFFSLALPKYTSKEILKTKFLKAMECTLMDADVRLRSAEGWAEV